MKIHAKARLAAASKGKQRSPYDQGYDAGLNDHERSSCPYPAKSQERKEWEDGFDAGVQDQEQ